MGGAGYGSNRRENANANQDNWVLHVLRRGLTSTMKSLIPVGQKSEMPGMNGTEAKIEIFKPFGEAFELTKKILFQPFDLMKWLVIGFAAFLSGHVGGVGINFRPRQANHMLPPHFDHWRPWLQITIAFFALLVFALIIVLVWLKARGNFIFTHCVVRNRAAIREPWREYRKEGNSYFLFFLAIMLGVLVLVAIMIATFIALGWLGYHARERSPITFIGSLLFLFVFWLSISIFIGVVSYFMAPVMYRRRCRARS